MTDSAPNAPGSRSQQPHDRAAPDVVAHVQPASADPAGAGLEVEQRTAEIQEAGDLFRCAFASMPEALFLLDRTGRIVAANPAAGALLGRAAHELVGQPFSAICSDGIPTTPCQLLEGAPGGAVGDLETEIRAAGGQTAPVRVSRALVRDERANVTGVLVVVREATGHRRGDRAWTEILAREQAARAEAEAAERRYRDLVEGVDAIVWEADAQTWQFTFVSRRAEVILGYPVERWIREPDFWAKLIRPDDRERSISHWAACTRAGRDHELEYRAIAADGRVVWLRDIVRVITDPSAGTRQLRGLTMDVTARKQLERRLAAQHAVTHILAESPRIEEAVRRILQSICGKLGYEVGGFWSVDRAANVLRCLALWHAPSVQIRELAALSRDPTYARGVGLPGRVWARGEPVWIPDLGKDAPSPLSQAAYREGLRTAFGFPITLGGETLGVLKFFSREPRQADQDLLLIMDAIGGLIGHFIERRRAEEERAGLLASAQAARAEAEAANRAKDHFLATVSHELRTPLNAMLGWAKMLRTGRLDEASRTRALEVIERNARLQAQLIDDLLDVSRIIAGNLRLDLSPVELTSVIQAAVDAVGPAADARGVQLHVDLDPTVGPVLGDTTRMHQIVWNLLSNAVKFTPGGGSVEIRLERTATHARITVADTGAGIAPDFLPHVFEPFRQAESTGRRSRGGLGLGLAIARQLVELHGGVIRATSTGTGGGATFTVEVPLLAPQAGAAGPIWERPLRANEWPGAQPSLEGVRVLVVDDEPDALDLLAELLGQHGADVAATASAAEGLAALERLRPDILISDVAMPGEDGYELIRRVRQLTPEQGGTVPAVALTAYGGAEVSRRLLSAGFQSHLVKPAEPAELLTTIARLLGERPGGAAGRAAGGRQPAPRPA